MNHGLTGSYSFSLVALSFAIAVFASYTALDLSGRVRPTARPTRWIWFLGGAAAMGTGILSMPFVAILAFHLSVVIGYNLLSTLVSLLYAIVASGIALWLWSRPDSTDFWRARGSKLYFSRVGFRFSLRPNHYASAIASK